MQAQPRQQPRTDFRQAMLPEVDHKLAVWQAYLNVLNSFGFPQMISHSEEGETMNTSRAPQEAYVLNLAILDSMLDEDKDEPFRKDSLGHNWECNSMIELMVKYPPDLENKGDPATALIMPNYMHKTFVKYIEYFSRIDKLMRRQGMFTTQKMADLGHV